MQLFKKAMLIIGDNSMENDQNVYVDYESIKTNIIRDLEILTTDELTKQVNKLNEIVDHIEQNWHGSNAERSKQEINNIIDTIANFKKTCLDRNLQDITAQIDEYQKNEEIG